VSVWVGTSGYNYPEWRGTFYPEGFPAGRMLAYYAERFRTVEINYTFYRMPSAATIAGWVAETPPGFRFTLKASRRITHDARLRDIAAPLGYFLEAARGLGDRLGPILVQLPPNLKRDAGRLGDLLALLPPGLRCALEFRHESWLVDETYDLLRRHNAALCVADTGEHTTPLVPTADFGYFRLRDEGYDAAALARWAAAARRPEWREAYVYFKHEDSGRGPALAAELLALLA
jgi:uncharacterized protein YecE (DUF72 family)